MRKRKYIDFFLFFFYLSFHISCSCVPFWSCIWSSMSGGHTGSCWLWRSSAVRNVANEEKCWKKASVPIKPSHIFSLFVSTLHGRSFPLSLLILLHSSSLVLSTRTGTLYLQESGGEKNAFSCFYHQEFIVQTILCLMPLQRLTSVCLELQVIVSFFFPQILTMIFTLKGWVNIALTHHQSTLFCFHDESTFIASHALI